MVKLLYTLLLSLMIICWLGSCRADRVEIHGRRGKIRHMRSRTTTPWHTPDGAGYSKHTHRRLLHWDRNMHK